MYAPDGSPVEFYRRLPPLGEPELIHSLLPPASDVLELGCGAGRITHALVALGHRVVAVDQSAAMLAHVRGAETVCADIETLDLGRTFAAVLLASHLVNVADDARRTAFLRTCRRHVAPDGVVIVQRLDPAWARSAADATYEEGGFRQRLENVRRSGRLISATSRYQAGDAVWTHAWTMRVLDELELRAMLAGAGLEVRRWLGRNRTWLVAAPVAAGSA